MKDENRTIIWPDYLDSKKTKSEGRKISKKQGVSSPKIREISQAAKKLGLNPSVEKYKSYPPSWWEGSGRVIVDKKMSKREVLLKLSNMIKGSRSTDK
ncbi:signal recognition particle protein Srp19 [Methanobacterium ferruginis]|jgi:signal recognition particle subunit SRP19|uniref:signal recognition particle protein Srp19 n=1 Tax=Methanobacterium ferruginis TaxID=710191 RepID=UPI0025747275|nr:signal recognition particle protein Srp19 [Methanobacterium ferruginis]MCC7549978.1 signal recognition particle protein Srp19 [Methanobacterium sp.]BDZ68180.1 signal recognition particle protein Srp19 [Methanobacterium ferruginis]